MTKLVIHHTNFAKAIDKFCKYCIIKEVDIEIDMEKYNMQQREKRMQYKGFESLKKQDIKEQVFEQLLMKIEMGEWKPGEKLPSENELTKAMGVSRITIREAIQKLVAINVVETFQGKGTFVKTVTSNSYLKSMTPMLFLNNDDIRAVLEYRKIIEVGIIDILIEKATEKDISILKKYLDKMSYYYNKKNLGKYKEYDLNFHMKLYEMTDNPFIIKISNIAKDVMNSAMSGTLTEQGAKDGLEYHGKIIECIENRNAEELKKITKSMLDAVEVEGVK
ncbi:HTH-type transcriptional repressor NanR [Schaedlerella arabinosiphila]|nr:HTH-type transcriptional repressor NanR [Schaedlerella arabinosiphila]